MGELNIYRQAGTTPNFSDIARRHGVNRHTVSKYWNEEEAQYDKRSNKQSVFEEFRDVVEEKALLPGITKRAIYEYLIDRYPCDNLPKYNAFTQYCRANGILCSKASSLEPHPRFETPPGRQLQFDWKENIRMVDINGEVFDFNVFSATLSYSRLHVYIYSKTRTTDDLLRCFVEVIRRTGGVCSEWLSDNMSSIVSFVNGRKVKSSRVERFAREAGFELQLCKAHTPQTKGKDESSNRFLNRLVAYNHDFAGEEELIQIIAHIEQRSNAAVNETTGLPPATLFMKEKEYLAPAGNMRLLEELVGEVSIQSVPSTMLIRAKGNFYSVPRKCIGRKVKVTIMPGGQITVTMDGNIVAIHDASRGTRKFNYTEQHYIQAIENKERFLDEDIRQAAIDNLALLDSIGGE